MGYVICFSTRISSISDIFLSVLAQTQMTQNTKFHHYLNCLQKRGQVVYRWEKNECEKLILIRLKTKSGLQKPIKFKI